MPPKIEKASRTDIDAIHGIIESYAMEGIVLERSMEEIGKSLDMFFVARSGKGIDGVISYHDYGPELKEVRSLCVTKNSLRKGTGSLLLKQLIEHLLERKGNIRIFVLTYNPEFFRKNLFRTVDRNSLPEKIWKDCDNCKNKDDCGETAMVYTPG